MKFTDEYTFDGYSFTFEYEFYAWETIYKKLIKQFGKDRVFIVNTHYDPNIGSKLRLDAYNDELEKLGIGWHTYIKFFVTEDGKRYGLVAGKSGSRTVIGDPDLSFDMDRKDKKGRHFLNTNSLKWYTEKVMVIKTISESENEAYRIEDALLQGIHLFES